MPTTAQPTGSSPAPTSARLRSQLLSGPPARSPVAVAERLLAIQGQDPRGARLAIRARSRGLTAADVDRALDERELLIAWLNRGTLHLVRSEDYFWLHALTTPQLRTASSRRLAQEGVTDPERRVRRLVALLADGPLTQEELSDALGLRGPPLYHVLFRAALDGLVVRGPLKGGRHAYVLVRDWLGEPPPLDRDAALRELGRRYLAGHAPADERDLARWAGITLRDARLALGDATPPRRSEPPLPPPKLLGAFDPVLLGWVSREPIVGPHRHLVTDNGIFRPFALVDGRAVATWSLDGGIEELEPLASDVRAALDRELAAARQFLGR